MTDGETPRPPATPEFGAVTPGGPAHAYPDAGAMRARKLAYGPYDNNVYVLVSGGEALIIDAAAPVERVRAELGDARVAGIVITHDHADHTQTLAETRAAFDVPVYAHPSDRWPAGVTSVGDGDEIPFGSAALRVVHAPGHTPGSICLSAPGFVFSGDALFPGGPGNTGGDPERFARAIASLERLFASLPDDTRVCPGHGLDTTIGRERPYLDVWRARGW